MSAEITSSSVQLSPHMGFEEVEHMADRALRIFGSNLKELLCNAAKGMNSLMVAKYPPASHQIKKTVLLETIDAENLLVEWLSELTYWAETAKLVFREFDIKSVSPTHVRATIYGNRVPSLDRHIKAVTYHNLEVLQTESGLTATVVFDV
jgi:SHS2 domain-containing protein